ncbi:MAG: PocR ligand-binding domain-containing protein [Clostridium sp.]|nr:PocR ligand-binding domain-containing protein [Clostridium sp.]
MDFELDLKNLIDISVLERIQSAFAKMTGFAAITTDANGVPVTEGSNFSEFCTKYMRTSPIGCERCQQCDRYGAERTQQEGQPCVYICHAGLVDFAAPIVVQDEIIGCLIGGQVRTKELDWETAGDYAEEIGIDREEYLQALRQTQVVTQESVDNAAEFLYTLTDILSSITYNQYLVFHANLELGKTVQMRSDFLANMSHEIRTPMNAVIGMAELALREELPSVAREYINQIKVAGKSLLTIINDILDFSKIESGKMDIIPEEYEPISMLYDVANIIATRLKDKDVELVLDVPPDLPNKLYGDSIRIKQILLNLANNAAKFTSKGRILLQMGYTRLTDEKIEMQVSIEDTGIGIKKEDMDKLFLSFSQLDSKRNRNVEGTGLGLAISKRLLTLMHGTIKVESEYEKGSKFSFVLPQTVMDNTPSVAVKNQESVLAAGLISNLYIKESLKKDITTLGVEYIELDSIEEFHSLTTDKKVFLFVEEAAFSGEMQDFVKEHPDIEVALLIDFFSTVKYDMPNLLVVRKPFFVLTLATLFNGDDLELYCDEEEAVSLDFIATDAEVLIVDDNAVNLKVAEGLLEPLQMKVDTALSGQEAIDKISMKHYDIIFMDHMMPEIDGIEATHIIRRLHPEYNDVPIIALSANAVEGTKEMFCKEGMNDFVAKPIELHVLLSKLKQWLPVEKIQKTDGMQIISGSGEFKTDIVVGDLDVQTAINALGGEKLFWTVLKEYYRTIHKKVELIQFLEEQEDWVNYTIEVHALKSASKQIGAMSLSEKAAELEKAGNARNGELIHQKTKGMLEQYFNYISVLQPFCDEKKKDNIKKKRISSDILEDMFKRMKAGLEDLDMDEMESVIQEMEQYSYTDEDQELFVQLREAVEDMDVDACEAILQTWTEQL